jgi:hypothetical protein
VVHGFTICYLSGCPFEIRFSAWRFGREIKVIPKCFA